MTLENRQRLSDRREQGEMTMNDRIDERKVNRYLYEVAGRAGTS